MKKLLPLVAVLATTVTGCWTGGSGSVPLLAKNDVKPVPVEEFKPVSTPSVPLVTANDITAENAKEKFKQLQNEMDRDQ